MPDARIDRGAAACEADMLPTELPSQVIETEDSHPDLSVSIPFHIRILSEYIPTKAVGTERDLFMLLTV